MRLIVTTFKWKYFLKLDLLQLVKYKTNYRIMYFFVYIKVYIEEKLNFDVYIVSSITYCKLIKFKAYIYISFQYNANELFLLAHLH